MPALPALPALLALLAPGCRCGREPAVHTPIAAVWAIGDGDALERDDRRAPAPSAVWDGQRVKLFAARNEIVAFQLIVRAGSRGIGALRASLPGLARQGAVGGAGAITYAPPAADPTDFRGRPIQLFSVGYMNVTRVSRCDWIYNPDGPDAPADPLGQKPVQLIPENARAGRGGFPLAVRAGENQALWFDIYTGRDRPAGLYRGTITLVADGQSAAVPVELELLDFALPDENSLLAMVYYESEQPQLYQGRDLDAAYHRFAHRQRIELTQGYDLPALRAAAGRFDGSDFSADRYDGPGRGAGNRIIPASFYGPGPGWEGRGQVWPRADDWMTYLREHHPRALTFLYLPDEPPPEQYPYIRSLAETVHSNPGPGRALPTFVTRPYVRELEGAIDIWCSTPPDFDPRRAAAQRAAGRGWWLYNGGRPGGPALVMEAPPTDARVVGWMAFKAETPVYFQWHAVHWRHNHQKKRGDRNQNVWADPVTFDSRGSRGGGDYANGEGVLIYPGTERLHPDQDRGIEGPISTLRLANLRRGLQDHLYLTLARRRGQEALVRELVEAIVPRVFAEAKGRVSFPESTEAFERARLRLARALAGDSPRDSGAR